MNDATGFSGSARTDGARGRGFATGARGQVRRQPELRGQLVQRWRQKGTLAPDPVGGGRRPSSSTTPSWSTRCWRRPPTAPSPNSRPGLRPMASRPAPCLTSWASAPPGGRVSAVAASSRDRVIGRSAELAFRASLAQPAPQLDQRRAFRSAPAAGPSRRSALLEGGQLPEYRTAPWRRPSGGRPGVSRSVAAPPRRAAPS